MRAVTFEELPPPPEGRTGWPWTEAPRPLPPLPAGVSTWPRISIVTPSYNQADFLEETIRSVLLQGYPDLEYVVIDGGSTDGSRQIIETYSPWLSHWVCEPDRGQYQAINKGFNETSGKIMAWINSDDKYAPAAFPILGQVFSRFPGVEWVSSLRRINWDARGGELRCRPLPGFSRDAFWFGEYGVGVFRSPWIQQESTFWRRSLWRRAGKRVDDELQMAGDFDLWTRFYRHADLYGIEARLGGFRIHPGQKTERGMPLYLAEARRVFAEQGGRPHGLMKAIARKLISRMPRPARSRFQAMGLAFPTDVLVPAEGGDGWEIEETPV